MDNIDGDNLSYFLYNYVKGLPRHHHATSTDMRQSRFPANHPEPEAVDEPKELQALMAEAEDLCVQFAIEIRLEAHRARAEAERISKEMVEEDAERRAGYSKP